MAVFKKGEPRPANAGRKAGSRNVATKALKEMILGALDEAGGQQYLARQAKENPGPFLALIGRVLPTTLAGDPDAPLKIISRIDLVPVEPSREAQAIEPPPDAPR